MLGLLLLGMVATIEIEEPPYVGSFPQPAQCRALGDDVRALDDADELVRCWRLVASEHDLREAAFTGPPVFRVAAARALLGLSGHPPVIQEVDGVTRGLLLTSMGEVLIAMPDDPMCPDVLRIL